MTKVETSKEIDDVAALWAARLDRGALGELDQVLLNAWLDGDNRRLGALTRAQALLVPLQQQQPQPQRQPILERLGLSSISSALHASRRRVLQLGVVAALIAAIGASRGASSAT